MPDTARHRHITHITHTTAKHVFFSGNGLHLSEVDRCLYRSDRDTTGTGEKDAKEGEWGDLTA